MTTTAPADIGLFVSVEIYVGDGIVRVERDGEVIYLGNSFGPSNLEELLLRISPCIQAETTHISGG